MAAARAPNQIMTMFARKKQKLSTVSEPQIASAATSPAAEEAAAEVPTVLEPPVLQTCSTHPTYPFPIADLPSPITLRLGLTAPASPAKLIKRSDLDLLHFRPFFKLSTASLLYEHLLASLPWYKVEYLARGMTVTTPRFTTVFGLDETAVFEPRGGDGPAQLAERSELPVAGTRVLSAISKQPIPSTVYAKPPRPIPRCLQALKDCVERATNETFNFVLVNFYADGSHSISPHSDDESFLGESPCVASLSLGGTRDFVMKHKTKREVGGEKFALKSGDMVVMRGTTMAHWLHGVPKRVGKTQVATGRINVTFRKAINARGSNNYAHYNVGNGPAHRFVDGNMVQIGDNN